MNLCTGSTTVPYQFIKHSKKTIRVVDNAGYLARLAKVAEKAIYFTDVFSLFFIFLVVTPGATLAQKLMDRSSRKFRDW